VTYQTGAVLITFVAAFALAMGWFIDDMRR
jgi:hypothetical protein